jgi:sugar lactone lactonase YvrE
MAHSVEVVVSRPDPLGEGVIWDHRAQLVYWTNIRGPTLYRYDPVRTELLSVAVPEPLGSIALSQGTGLLLATKSGLYAHRVGSEFRPLVRLDEAKPNNRCNDGRCDPAGRFWVGTMSDVERSPAGSLYCYAPSGELTTWQDNITIPNSLAWSPDGRRMYFADTWRNLIWAYDYDLASGVPSNQRIFFDTSGNPGSPDGSAVDSDGCLWNAEYGGGRIVRYRPDGSIDLTITLPVTQPTCVCFGGSDLRTLYITTAAQRLSAGDLARQPLAGSLLAVQVATQGVPEARFGAAL